MCHVWKALGPDNHAESRNEGPKTMLSWYPCLNCATVPSLQLVACVGGIEYLSSLSSAEGRDLPHFRGVIVVDNKNRTGYGYPQVCRQWLPLQVLTPVLCNLWGKMQGQSEPCFRRTEQFLSLNLIDRSTGNMGISLGSKPWKVGGYLDFSRPTKMQVGGWVHKVYNSLKLKNSAT